MEPIIRSFIGLAKRIRLTALEKVLGKKNVMNHVTNARPERLSERMGTEHDFLRRAAAIGLSADEHACGKEALLAHIYREPMSWPSFAWLNPFKNFASITASLLIVAIGGGSVSYAAESALPGDMLYAVKMNFNEPMVTTLTRTPMGQAKWQGRQAERRLEEAEKLASGQKLNATLASQLGKDFTKHTANMHKEMDKMKAPEDAQNAQDMVIGFSATLRAHSALLTMLMPEEQDGDLLSAVHDVSMDMAEAELTNELSDEAQNSETHSALDRLIAKASDEIRALPNDAQGQTLTVSAKAQEDLSHAKDMRLSDPRESMRMAKKALRKCRQSMLMAQIPMPQAKATAEKSAEQLPQAAMMMRAESAPLGDAIPSSGAGGSEAEDDMQFATNVRLRLTKHTIENVGKTLGQRKSPDMPLPIEARMDGAAQLMDIANLQLDAGNVHDAFEASDMALKHAQAAHSFARKDMQLSDE